MKIGYWLKDTLLRYLPFALDGDMQEIIHKASSAFALKILGAGLQFLFSFLLAKTLGAEGVGVYFLAFTLIRLVSTIARLGLPSLATRWIATYIVKDQPEQVVVIQRTSLTIITVSSTLLTLVIIASAPFLAQSVFSKPLLATPLQIAALAILPVSLSIWYAAALRGLKHTNAMVFIENVGVFGFGMFLLLLLGRYLTSSSSTLILVLSSLLTLAIGIGMWKRVRPRYERPPAYNISIAALLITAMPLFAISLMTILQEIMDTLLAGIWLDSQALGVYTIAIRAVMAIRFASLSINTIAAPQFAALYAQGKLAELDRLTRHTALLASLICLPIAMLYLGMPKTVMGIFGQDFADGATTLVILTIAQLVNTFTGSIGELLLMTGREKPMRNLILMSMLVSLILQVILAPRYGIIGVSLASASGIILFNVTAALFAWWGMSVLTFPIPDYFMRQRL
jgi:O-antigen/teichoic acid export membrane protein